MMRAKFKVQSVLRLATCDKLEMKPVVRKDGYPDDGRDENNTFAKFSPSGLLELAVTNPDLIGKFNPGDEYYLDFTKAN